MAYDPSEPRVPSGSSSGGQWTSGHGAATEAKGPPEVSPKMLRDYQLGKKIRAVAGGEPTTPFLTEWAYNGKPGLPDYDTVPGFGLDNRDAVGEAFVNAGMQGADMPSPTIGYRMGKAPVLNFSKNHVTGKLEAGVSMARVADRRWADYTWAMGSSSRDIHYYSGYVLHHAWGSDGEPLMVGLKEVDRAAYLAEELRWRGKAGR